MPRGSSTAEGTIGLGGRRSRAPEVIPGPATVRGLLDKEIVRRVVRRHLNEVRFCYEQELATKPALGGRMIVQFTIAATGQVIASILQASELDNRRVETCVVQAVRRWEFPEPLGGGTAVVSFPFVLTPARGAQLAAAAPVSLAPLSPPRPPPAPAWSTWEPLVALAGDGELAARVERVAALLGPDRDRTSDPESLAWTIDRRGQDGREIVLVARLLTAAHADRDAVRVLFEGASDMPLATAEELRSMGAEADAAEVLTVAKRGR